LTATGIEKVQLLASAWKRRIAGVLLMALGGFALAVPLALGRWSLATLGIPLVVLSVAEARAAFKSQRRDQVSAYVPSMLAMAAGNLLLLSSALVLSGLLFLLLGILLINGLSETITVWRKAPSERIARIVNGIVDLGCAALLWFLSRIIGAELAVGIVIGVYIVSAGWRMFMAPPEAATPTAAAEKSMVHPDPGLNLPPNEIFARLHAEIGSAAHTERATELMWMLTLVGVFLAIHIGRMPISDTLLGIISPLVATGGDLFMTLVFATLVVLPWRLLWRRISRPAERLAWSLDHGTNATSARVNPAAAWLITRWLQCRFSFNMRLRGARVSLPAMLLLLMRLGLPVTAFFVAFNPIWGFSWYFNTESWATGVYQKLTQLRVDPWRESMIDAVTRAYGGGDELFRVQPVGTDGSGDFSFIVIGDPGEGDSSQYSLISRLQKLAMHDDVKFLVISSDVIYPAGAMQDYEANFYLPFQGTQKPVYAIPGNHDWFDALEGFNANFLEPRAAAAAIAARVEADLGLTTTTARRIDRLGSEAARLRRLYGVNVGTQRAVFFELQTPDFALLAIDTGILRTVDQRQWAWLQRALDRSQGKFIMAIVGHPRFAGGHDTPPIAEGQNVSESTEKFSTLYQLLAKRDVRIAMAGDTHDFEYYREKISREGRIRTMHHFVNGGGGAYLSIGTAFDFPKQPAVADWAFYPRSDRLREKMDAEMPLWKQPFWYWIKWFKAWPFNVEALSGLFDFNRAPFFQSFVEVRVERSKKRVVVILNGVDGPLRWRDLQIGGVAFPAGASLSDPVEFVVPMDRD
jgi:uncharacterized membrane protein HdeD (DUF308 family)